MALRLGSRSTQAIAGVVTGWFLASSLGAVRAGAQDAPGGRCDLLVDPVATSRVQILALPSGQHNTFVGGGAHGRCPAQNMVLIADSAEYYGDQRLLILIGNVHYTEPRLTLNSERLTYWQNDERLRAEGHVDATLPSGTNMLGPVADYYRAVPPIRTTARMFANGRPTIKIIQLDSVTHKPSDPVFVIANNVSMEGDTLVYAGGKVEITRPDIVSHSDSAIMNSEREIAHLIGHPVIDGKGERPFTLTGTLVDLFGQAKELNRVLSSGNARTVSEDVTLTADTLDFRMANRLMQQGYAWGKSRAHAVSPSYDILADSLSIKMPAQKLEEVRAMRDAFAQSVPDTLRIRTRERDWMRGDTIIAYFDSSTTRPNPAPAAPKPASSSAPGASSVPIPAPSTTRRRAAPATKPRAAAPQPARPAVSAPVTTPATTPATKPAVAPATTAAVATATSSPPASSTAARPPSASSERTGPRIRELIAIQHARSFYHIASKDTIATQPAINYVTGRRIVVSFADQQVQRVTITEQASGVYLDPTPPVDSTKPKKPVVPPVRMPAGRRP